MRILISGGCKMGKSSLAQRIAVLQGTRRIYIATMRPHDEEDVARIARHRRERAGLGFETAECPWGGAVGIPTESPYGAISSNLHRDMEALTGKLPRDASLLLDSTTALLSEAMFAGGGLDPDAAGRVLASMLSLCAGHENLVFVSDAIYSDATRYDASTEAYRRGLARIDRELAARCDGVIEAVFGNFIIHKGGERVDTLVDAAGPGLFHGPGDVHGAAGGRKMG